MIFKDKKYGSSPKKKELLGMPLKSPPAARANPPCKIL